VVAVGRAGSEPGMVGRSPDAFVQARRAERMAERRGGLGGGFCPLCLVHGMRGARGSKGQWHGGRQHADTVPAHWRAHRLEQVERLDDAATWRDTGGWIRARDGRRRRGLVVVAALARRSSQDARVSGGAERHRAPTAWSGGGRRVADGGATSGLVRRCQLPYVRADGRDVTAAADNAEAVGRSGAVAAAMEAGGVPRVACEGKAARARACIGAQAERTGQGSELFATRVEAGLGKRAWD
jgi:hypothetical protein